MGTGPFFGENVSFCESTMAENMELSPYRPPKPTGATKMKIKWPEPFPGAYWLDEREEKAVLDVLRRKSLFRFYGLKKPKYAATTTTIAPIIAIFRNLCSRIPI